MEFHEIVPPSCHEPLNEIWGTFLDRIAVTSCGMQKEQRVLLIGPGNTLVLHLDAPHASGPGMLRMARDAVEWDDFVDPIMENWTLEADPAQSAAVDYSNPSKNACVVAEYSVVSEEKKLFRDVYFAARSTGLVSDQAPTQIILDDLSRWA